MGFPGMHGRHFGDHCGGSPFDGIDLTDEQIEKIMESRQESFAKIAHARIEMGDLRRRLMKELGADKIDRSKISALTQQIKDQRSILTDLMVEKLTAIAEILTAEQRQSIRMKMMKRRLGIEDEPEERDDE
jgi:Spy/CpxP family protein refolding chaperone